MSLLAIFLAGLWIARVKINRYHRVVPEVDEPLKNLTGARMSPAEVATLRKRAWARSRARERA